jgi:hypothetical protein
MRNLLILIFFVCIGFLNIEKAQSQTTYPLTGHPRLFFLSADEAALKAKLNSTQVLKRVHDLIIAESDKMLTLSVQQRVLTGRRLLSVSREAIRRISFLSYAYRMTAMPVMQPVQKPKCWGWLLFRIGTLPIFWMWEK